MSYGSRIISFGGDEEEDIEEFWHTTELMLVNAVQHSINTGQLIC